MQRFEYRATGERLWRADRLTNFAIFYNLLRYFHCANWRFSNLLRYADIVVGAAKNIRNSRSGLENIEAISHQRITHLRS
ncbi:hypothetical protein ACFSUI_16620 [Ralstonia solanacearum]